MADSEISFNKLVSEIKQIVDLTLFNPKEFDKWQMSHVIHRTITNTTIAIPFTADYYWLHVIQYVRTKSKKWDSKLSDEYIANELTELIIDIKTDETKYSEFGKSVKTWLENLKKLPRINFRFVLPVNNVDYRKDIEFDKIKLKKINLKVLRSFVPFRGDEPGHFSPEEQLKDLTSFNDTEVFAFIDVQAKDQEHGRKIADFYLKRLIHAMRLFNPASGITERELYFPETKFPFIVVNLDENSFSSSFGNHHLNAHIWPSKEYWARVEPDWQQLSTFLFTDEPNEIQALILTALYWYGEAGKETEDELSMFLKNLHGLETLIIFDSQYDKGRRMAERLAKIFSTKDSKSFDFYNNLMLKYYKFRSGMIHSGKLIIDKEDVGTTNNWLRDMIFNYIRFSKKYDSAETLFKNEYSIDIHSSSKNGTFISQICYKTKKFFKIK